MVAADGALDHGLQRGDALELDQLRLILSIGYRLILTTLPHTKRLIINTSNSDKIAYLKGRAPIFSGGRKNEGIYEIIFF